MEKIFYRRTVLFGLLWISTAFWSVSYGQIRSVQNGLWSNPNTWQGGVVPTGGDEVILLHEVTFDASVSPGNPLISLTIENNGQLIITETENRTISTATLIINRTNGSTNFSNGTLNVTEDLTIDDGVTLEIGEANIEVSGNTIVRGTFSDSDDNGQNSFLGNVAVENGSFVIQNGSTCIFEGNISVNAGATLEISTNDIISFEGATPQTITANQPINITAGQINVSNSELILEGNSSITLNAPVTVTGVTITNNTNTIISQSLSGTGTWANGDNAVLRFRGSTMDIANFEAGAEGNRVFYDANAPQTVRSVPYHNLITAGSDIKTDQGGLTIANVLEVRAGSILLASQNVAHTFGGLVAVEGSLTIENATSATFAGNITSNGATNIGADNISFAGTNDQILSGNAALNLDGNVNLQANITNQNTAGVTITGNLTGTANWAQAANSALNYQGSELPLPNGNLTANTPGNTVNYNGTSPQTIRAITYANLAVGGNNLKQLAGADIFVQENFTASEGGTNFLLENGRVIFNGSSPQTISGQETSFFALEIDNAAGLNLASPTNINDQLVLSSGVINTTPQNILTLAENATSNEGNPGSYVNGSMRKIGDTDFTFPLGKNNIWAPLRISELSENATFTAEYFPVDFDINTPVGELNTTEPLAFASRLEHWRLNHEGTASARVSLFWKDGSRSGISALEELSIARWQASTNRWLNIPAVIPNNPVSNIQTGQIDSEALVNLFGFFTLATTSPENGLGNITEPPMAPILENVLSNQSGHVNLQWSTNLTSPPEAGFIIERAVGEANTFQFMDSLVSNTNTYEDTTVDTDSQYFYRVIAFNIAGSSLPSNIRGAIIASEGGSLLEINTKIYPNPTRDVLLLDWSNPTEPLREIELINVQGRLEHQWQLLPQGALKAFPIDISSLASGTYLLRFHTDTHHFTKKLVID